MTGLAMATRELNGKVEISHRTDQQEFYQLLSYTDDVDLGRRLAEWEAFYNYHRQEQPCGPDPLTMRSGNSGDRGECPTGCRPSHGGPRSSVRMGPYSCPRRLSA